MEVFLGGASQGTTVADAAGDWRFDHSGTVLADGSYEVTARAVDGAGNAGRASNVRQAYMPAPEEYNR